MARDAELDRLKVAQDHAFQRKQDAYKVQETAWQRRSRARDELNSAHEAQQRAYATQVAAWEQYQRVRSDNGPRIDSLNSQQENAFQSMKNACDRASSAHNMRDGASARMYADEGHRYKGEAQRCVTGRRRPVQDIRDAKERFSSTRPPFQHAKDYFDRAKREHDSAKDDHDRKQTDFSRAKKEFDEAANAFRTRLETVRAESQRKRDEKRSLAERAGVPYQYRDSVWISRQPDGAVNIYFGGIGNPNGLGHGHYAMDASGHVTYRRDPFNTRGSQNFAAPVYWHKTKMSFDRDTGTYQTDKYIGIVGEDNQKLKAHIAVDPDGQITFVRDLERPNSLFTQRWHRVSARRSGLEQEVERLRDEPRSDFTARH
jgi:hypothetical protein